MRFTKAEGIGGFSDYLFSANITHHGRAGTQQNAKTMRLLSKVFFADSVVCEIGAVHMCGCFFFSPFCLLPTIPFKRASMCAPSYRPPER